MNKLNFLSIITIAYKCDYDLIKTYKSIRPILEKGAKWILVISQESEVPKEFDTYKCLVGKDKGLYNALNLGLELVDNEYFMFMHSGDEVLADDLFDSIVLSQSYDIVLGGARIGHRYHLSKKWRPWMFNLYVQPPHLPIIYNKNFVGSMRFDENIEVVSDFYMLKDLFNRKPRWIHSGKTYVKMKSGGLTTGGFKSLMLVTNSFYKVRGVRAFLLFPIRVALKMIIS